MLASRKRNKISEDDDSDDNTPNLYMEQRAWKRPKFNSYGSISEESSVSTHRLSCDSIESTTSNRNTDNLSAESSDGELSPNCFVGSSSSDTNQFDSHLPGAASGISSFGSANSHKYSDMAKKMMSSMGYKEGRGLGRSGQGIVQPIEASNQRGTRGLGFSIQGLEPMNNLEWDGSKDFIEVKEIVLWLKESQPGDSAVLGPSIAWEEGPRRNVIHDEDTFCHPKILEAVLSNKDIFDKLSDRELMKARNRSNPFETIGKLFFLNRAALKMANMDSVCNFMFTSPRDDNGESLILPDEVLFFADVCAAPGGFSEYVLWKRKSTSRNICATKGFGFTLKENDFKLTDFYAAPAEFFEPHYGINSIEGDGDVYKAENIQNFRKFVLDSTFGRGVHFMMADGGFSVEGKENIQEILSKRLYLCQFLVALGIVRRGGHFVCKLFDLFTPFSIGLIYLMHLCFREISIHKPNSSRPANSERYIICKGKKECESVYNYLFDVNLRLDKIGEHSSTDINHLVPLEILTGNESFFNYIYNSNNDLGRRQIVGLRKIHAYCQDTHLGDDRQTDLRRESLEHWQLPDQVRRSSNRKNAKDKSKELLNGEAIRRITRPPKTLNLHNFDELISLYDYRFVVLTSSSDNSRRDRAFFLGLGGTDVFKWDGSDSCEWRPIDTKMELPPDTLVYGELTTEYVEDNTSQKIRRNTAFHLIDALVLNGFDIRDLHLVERHQLIKQFALSLNKRGRKDLAAIHCKSLHKLETIDTVLKHPNISSKFLPGNRINRRVFNEHLLHGLPSDEFGATIPTGIMLLKTSRDPWMMALSRSAQRKYWYNTHNKQSIFETPKEAIATFCDTFANIHFYWFDGVKLLETDSPDHNRLQISEFRRKIA